MAIFAAPTDSRPRVPTLDDLRGWWNAPTRYDLVMSYFAARSLLSTVRFVTGASAGALAIVPFVMEFSPLGPQTTLWRGVDFVAGLIATFWMLRWWFGPLPKERESVVFSGTSVAAICLACLADSDRVTGMYGLTALALMAVYICVFHGARLIALYLVTAAAALAFMALSLSVQHGWAVALAKSIVTAALIMGLPPVIHFALQPLTSDAAAAGIDQLTGLHNRRGFDDQSMTLVDAARAKHSELSAIVIDVDRFKLINDRFGHTVGDRVLSSAASRIESIAGTGSVVGRVGGEEFCVAMVATAPRALEVAERIRVDLESLDVVYAITASVGVATAGQQTASASGANPIPRLVEGADQAMYAAKRDGGNRVAVWQG